MSKDGTPFLTFGQGGASPQESQLLDALRKQEERAMQAEDALCKIKRYVAKNGSITSDTLKAICNFNIQSEEYWLVVDKLEVTREALEAMCLKWQPVTGYDECIRCQGYRNADCPAGNTRECAETLADIEIEKIRRKK